MGSASSKFKKYLQHGDEFAAMQVFQSSPELRKNLDPNLSYGDSHQHNTALHYAAKHGMKHLLRTFLNDLGGNPNKKNAHNESSLHAACQLGQQKSLSAQERRAACVGLLLQWRGATVVGGGGARERVDPRAQDHRGNTALHCAASCGLKRCVELLLAHGAPLFLENHDKQTPCDLAMRSGHHDIARLLESRMVFADSSDSVNEAELYGEAEEVYSGLRTQDLQEAKDQLLVETSDMLHIPLFTAEALLRDNEWSREALLDKWMKDPVQCCLLAGVQPPATALQHCGTDVTPQEPPEVLPPPPSEPVCEICTLAMPCWDWPVQMSCGHRFCSACWERYLTVKIQDGDAHHILCPAYQCHMLVPVEVIEKLVSPDMARRYLQFDIKAFVESNRCIKWCPMAGCGRAVRLPETEQLPPRKASPPPTSHAVDCGNGHFFCWECLGEAHAPSSCAQWQQWQHKISEVRFEELRASCTETEDAANCLWLVTNSKPCPNCKSPIQKNEGCNHMKCSKCKCDFCWVCLENWKKHSSATGGYFRCNRFEAVHKADEKQGLLISEAVVRNQQMQELNRFLHYYTRFRNHENSHRLEEPLLGNARQKMELLASQQATEKAGTRFVEDGVRELLKARRVLCGSYVHGYYLQDDGCGRTIFEFMQNELEEVTEKLSEMVARPYLRTPRALIIQTTALARRKRHEFVRAVAKGLIPPETPPPVRRRPHDDIAASLDTEAQSRGHALYDWPEVDSDDDQLQETLAVSLLGECARPGCCRPRTAALQRFCSLRCSRLAAASDVFRVNVTADYNMDLVIALEMSRLQMIEDEMKKRQRAEAGGNKEAADEQQLKLAIELSLQDGGGEGGVVGGGGYERTPADLTVDCFLRSLAGRPLLEAARPEQQSREWGCEDGRFQIGDLHQNGWVEGGGPGGGGALRRSHSTGDLCTRPALLLPHRTEPRYHLDSDHSSQHEERPEDAAHVQVLLLHHPSGGGGSSVYYGGQSSVEDTTTTSDSLNADLEVCGILGTTTEDEEGGALSCLEEDCSPAPPPLPLPQPPPPLLAPSALRIRICRSPAASGAGGGGGRRPLETDSSNEYESETGIPRSPTLFISGVSISRTPEPRSPGRSSGAAAAVPPPTPPAAAAAAVTSATAVAVSSPSAVATTTTPVPPPTASSATSSSSSAAPVPPPPATPPKSRSASEPERERQVFRFPKSSTDGALSSVLLVQESNLSSDDFHEALFLLEPKRQRKRSKKDRHSKEASSAL